MTVGGDPPEDHDSSASAEVVPRGTDPLVIDIGTTMRNQTNIIYTVRQDILITTRDKVDLALRRSLPRYRDGHRWLGPASLLASLIIALLTTDFRPAMGISADAWTAVFVCASIAAAVWTMLEGWRSIRRFGHRHVLDAIMATNDPEEASLPTAHPRKA